MDRLSFVRTDRAAVIGGPYSQAVVFGNLVFVSGQGPIDPCSNLLCPGFIEKETEMALENLKIILEEAGSSLEKVLQVTVYLSDIKEYGRFNKVYKRYFREDRFPARSCIEAARLPLGIKVEMDAVAYV
jgi:2-iminobutanoate/2-iminopropanoate deaminase